MPSPLIVKLSESQRQELEEVCRHHPKPYMRERAAAILKIASGISGRETALNRLNQAHWPDTIYEWLKRYQTNGVDGLVIKKGRGRKPAFFPSVPE